MTKLEEIAGKLLETSVWPVGWDRDGNTLRSLIDAYLIEYTALSKAEDWRKFERHMAEALARAAVEAMREQSEAIINAYYERCDLGGDLYQEGDYVEDVWRAMIDAILSEKPCSK